MAIECLTNCECSEAGWCDRHQTFKGHREYRMCQRSADSYQSWEEKKFGQIVAMEARQSDAGVNPIVRGARLLKASLRFMASGCPKVSQQEYEQRLSICQACQFCELTRMICTQHSCGCSLERKARWQTEGCPEGLWPSPRPDD